jgi:hypothetical protein
VRADFISLEAIIIGRRRSIMSSRSSMRAGVLAVAVLASAGQFAVAAPFTNGSFEVGTPGTPNSAPTTGTATGWTLTGNLVVQHVTGILFSNDPDNNPNYYLGASNGVRAIAFNDGGAVAVGGGTLSQTFDVTPGTTYSVSFDYGTYGSVAGGFVGGLTASVTGGSPLFSQTYTDATGTPYGLATINQTFDNVATFTFVADSTSAVLSFVDASTGNANPADIGLDNVSVSAVVVPEPASIGLIGMAGAVLIARRRRA